MVWGWRTCCRWLGGFFYALAVLTTRTLCQGETTLSLLAGFFAWMVVLGGIGTAVLLGIDTAEGATDGFLLRPWGPVTGEAVMWLFIQAAGSVGGVFMLTRGYQLAEASYAAIFEYSLLPLALFWGLLVFGQSANFWDLVGIVLIFRLWPDDPLEPRGTGNRRIGAACPVILSSGCRIVSGSAGRERPGP